MTNNIKKLFSWMPALIVGICMLHTADVYAQSAQVINETGGTNLTDGLKIQVNLSGALAVYRENKTQYYSAYTWPTGATGGVALTFRFSQGTNYNAAVRTFTACTTTAVETLGNTSTSSITGYVTSPISAKRFYVTMNVSYTHPQKYFIIDYYVRAPSDLATAETVHIYLDHDAMILGSDRSRAYRIVNSTGQYVGNYRNNFTFTSSLGNTATNCGSGGSVHSDARPSSGHGFKASPTGFRSYFSGYYGDRHGMGVNNMLTNTLNTETCVDDGIAVEFVTPALSAGQIGVRRILHCYGDSQTEFDGITVTDPAAPGGNNMPVTVNFTSATFNEPEGNTTHPTANIKITVQGGTLSQPQTVSFTCTNGTALQSTHYTYVKGFTIPAGNYATAQTLTLNNINIVGNTVCDIDRTFTVAIDEATACNDLIIRGTTIPSTTVTIVDDEVRPTVTTTLPNLTYYHGQSVPAITFATDPADATVVWTNTATSIGLAASGTAKTIPTFIANNTTSSDVTATITITPTKNCAGTPKTFTITVKPRFTITYHYESGTAPTTPNPTTYTYGSTVTISNEPTRTGYAFAGWRCPELSITTPQKPFVIPPTATSNLSLYADWGLTTYNITYTLNGGTVELPNPNPSLYNVTTAAFTLKNPVRTGYTFTGWSGTGLTGTTNLTVTVPVGSTGDRTYTANWSINTYNITYNFNSGTAPATANKATYQVTELPFTITTTAAANQPTRTGYDFDGWTGHNITTPTKTINVSTATFTPVGVPQNLTYTANWTLHTYAITYNLDGGTATNPTSYTYTSSAITLTNPTRTGYTFAGWSGTGLTGSANMSVSIPAGSTGDRAYTATWTRNNYTIGYTLTTPAGNTTLVEVSPANPTTYHVETPSITLTNPTHPGYTFKGWTGSNGTTPQLSVSIPVGSTGNKSYTANWELSTSNNFNITYNLATAPTQPGMVVDPGNPTTFNYETPAFTLTAPTHPGYTFKGWTGSNGTTPQLSVTIGPSATGDRTYTANWELVPANNTFTIGYTLATPTTPALVTVTPPNPTSYTIETPSITLTAPTHPGYTFKGWTGSNGTTPQLTVTIPVGSTGNKNYTANWELSAANSFAITYTLATPTEATLVSITPNPTSYDVETNSFTLNNPTHPGYTFTGWSGTGLTGSGNTTVTVAKGSTGNRTYTAHWSAPVSFTITYTLNGGTVAAPPNLTTYTIETNTFLLKNPTREGYTFKGWSGTGLTGDANIAVSIPKGSTGNRTYTANWEVKPENAYTLIYVLTTPNGQTGTVATANPTTYFVNSSPITLNNPTHPGYTFTGWTGPGVGSPSTSVTIPTGSTGNRTYTANWSLTAANNFTISYTLTTPNGQTGTVSPPNPANYNIETPTITLNNPTHAGYTFTGWTGSNGTTPQLAVTIPVGSTGAKSYTANWELSAANNFSIAYTLTTPNGQTGVVGTPNPTTYNVETPAFTLNNPTHPGYTFIGWSGTGLTGTGNTSVTVGPSATGNRTYTANWNTTPISFTISYTLNGGTATNPTSYTIESSPITLNNPTRAGYTFTGWSGTDLTGANNMSVTIPTGSTGSRTYTAYWGIDTYTITYDPDGGTLPAISPAWQTYDMEHFPTGISIVPTRAGYTFKGWSGHGLSGMLSPFNIAASMSGVPGNLTFTAEWDVDNYTITYNPNGGIIVAGNPLTYNVTTFPVLISTPPTHLDPRYTFIGWNCVELPTIPKQMTYAVPPGTFMNLTMRANWSQKLDDLNGGSLDTLYACDGPRTLYADPLGNSWEWILPNGNTVSQRDISAALSGRYICHTNYGTLTLSDTLHVYFLATSGTQIEYISTRGAKIDRPQEFVLRMPPEISAYATSVWTLWGDGTVLNATTDSLKALWSTTGEKTISVVVTFNHMGVSCVREFVMKINILPPGNGFFVNQNVKGGYEDGSSWANAYKTIQEALDTATPGDYVWVAKGTYSPPAGTSYRMRSDSVSIFGGFNATEEFLYERNMATNITIMDGNGSHVLIADHCTDVRIDGFTLQGGRADKGGGVLFANGASGEVSNCIIRNNAATLQGGGVYMGAPWYGYERPLLTNTVISGNTAAEGAGIYNEGSSMILLNVTISGNKASSYGGGLYNEGGVPDIRNTIIWDNVAANGNNVSNAGGDPVYSYSLIGASHGSGASWDRTIGVDGHNNLDTNPTFFKKGFASDNVTMQQGDYHLTSSSPAIDRGYVGYVDDAQIQTPWDIFLLEPRSSRLAGLLMDLDNYLRVSDNDRVDMGAYEFNSSNLPAGDLMREVIIPPVAAGLMSHSPGTYYVRSRDNFQFTIMPATHAFNLYLNVRTTRNVIPDEEGVVIERNSDGSYTVTILGIQDHIRVFIDFSHLLDNIRIEGTTIYSYKGEIHVITNKAAVAGIYDLAGMLIKQQKLPEGETAIALSPGVYVVEINGAKQKVIVH